MPEELALEETFRHCAAIQFDERSFLSGAVLMDSSCDELLSGTAFSGDQHGSIGRRNELNLLDNLPKPGTSPDDIAEVLFGANFIEQVRVMSLKTRFFLLHQHLVGHVKKHDPRVLASLALGPPLNPNRTTVFLSTQLEPLAVCLSPAFDQPEGFAKTALSLGRVWEEGAPIKTCH